MTDANKLPEEFDLQRYVLIKDIQDSLQRYGAMTPGELERALRHPEATMFDRVFARLITQAANGDEPSMRMIFDRLWGKVTDRIALERDNHDERLKRIPRAAIIKLLRDNK